MDDELTCWHGLCSRCRSAGRLSAPSRRGARYPRSPLAASSAPATVGGPASARYLHTQGACAVSPQSFQMIQEVSLIIFSRIQPSISSRTVDPQFLLIRIQMFFSMPIRIQLLLKCWSGSSWNKFVTITLWGVFWSWKRQIEGLPTSIKKNHGAGPNRSRNFNKISIIRNFLAFFSVLLSFVWIQIQEEKWMQIHAYPDPQPWFADLTSKNYLNNLHTKLNLFSWLKLINFISAGTNLWKQSRQYP